MKKILLLLSITYLSCSGDMQKERLQKALNFENELTQNLIVKADSIIEIKGKKGLKITVKRKDLLGEISDSLKINLIELFEKEDFILANAQTRSNEKWLISAGAFKININGDEPLKLKEGKTIKIKFPLSVTENSMELFYGERNNKNDINWNKTNIRLEKESYYTYSYKDSLVIDIEKTKAFQGIEYMKKIILIDTLGYLNLELIKDKVNDVIVDNDTIRIYEKNNTSRDKPISNNDDLIDEITSTKFISITKNQADSVLSSLNYYSRETSLKASERKIDIDAKIYSTIQSSKLGWINVDKFAPEEEKVEVQLIDVLYNSRTYLVDKDKNTVLNIYNNKINIPLNRKFQIISFGIMNNEFYAFKKTIKYSSNGKLKLKYRKIKEKRIKDFIK